MSVALKTAPGHRLRADAAAAFDAANAGRRWVLTDSERPLSVQIEIFLKRYIPARTGGGWYGDVRWWNSVRYVRIKGTAAAAVPGTSKHGLGDAIDVRDLGHVGSEAWEAFRRDVEPHGWRHPAWAKAENTYEPWHWEYFFALDTHTVSRPGGGTGVPDISTPGGQLPAPILPKGFLDMLTDEEQRKLLDNTDSLLAILLRGSTIDGVKYSGMVPVLATVFGDVKKVPGRVWTDVAVQRSTGPVSVIQELANAGTAVAQLRGEVAGAQAALAVRGAGTGTDLTADQLEQIQAAARRGAAEGVADGIDVRVIVTTQEDPA